MKRLMLFLISNVVLISLLSAQENIEKDVENPESISESIFNDESQKKLHFGGYGQIDYNQPFDKDFRQNGKLDVHRLILFAGYEFNSKTKFITEIEFEHVSEVFIEQAYLNYRLVDNMSVKGGLILIPMGIINEYHEPPSFNGVERPNVDNVIVPTTWREIGFGVDGRINVASLRYQLYLVNGFNGYDGAGTFKGSNGLRSGRQKGAESYISSPNVAVKIDFYGLSGLKLGLSGYFGKSQSILFDDLDKNDNVANATADSSVIGISMVGLDYRYSISGFQTRGQFIYSKFTNVEEYNAFTGSDLGESMLGYYAEISYDIFNNSSSIQNELTPFIRFEKYNTHNSVISGMTKNDAYNITELISGFAFKMDRGAAFKVDYRMYKDSEENKFNSMLNMGIGVWF
ncbi:MAG: hypothetical protein KOO66_10615 [Bacteroidales bacterium]|nr:hypothetical protein [Bacteroidales bacterium]